MTTININLTYANGTTETMTATTCYQPSAYAMSIVNNRNGVGMDVAHMEYIAINENGDRDHGGF